MQTCLESIRVRLFGPVPNRDVYWEDLLLKQGEGLELSPSPGQTAGGGELQWPRGTFLEGPGGLEIAR